MKNMIKLLLGSLFLIITFFSCKKDENRDFYEGGTPIVLSANTAALNISYVNRDNEAIKLIWTNPDYKFTTGISSQSVSYLVEIDTTGANFTNPNKKSITISQNLSISFTQGEFNDFLLNQLVLLPGVPHNIEIRVTSTLANNSVPIVSNVLKYIVTPYAIPPKVAPPTFGTLWITGDAAPSGWSNPLGAPHNVNQKFTMISNTLYQLTLTMPGGGAYKLIQEQGNWGTQYHMLAGGTWEGGDFEKKDADPAFPGPPAAGSYKIVVDFQRGKFTVTKL